MSTAAAPPELDARVTGALATVTDPELDRSVVELGFATVAVGEGGQVTVELRLPTFWCAPNFAYLMAADARAVVAAVPGVRSVSVRVLDHFSGSELEGAVNSNRPFDSAFGDLADGTGLAALRRLFLVKAFTARQDLLLRRLLAEGISPQRVCAMRLADLDLDAADCRAYVDRRRRAGLPMEADSPLAVRPNGAPLDAGHLVAYLDRARLTRVAMEANTSLCSGLHSTRYRMPESIDREGAMASASIDGRISAKEVSP